MLGYSYSCQPVRYTYDPYEMRVSQLPTAQILPQEHIENLYCVCRWFFGCILKQ